MANFIPDRSDSLAAGALVSVGAFVSVVPVGLGVAPPQATSSIDIAMIMLTKLKSFLTDIDILLLF
jgi:hypothetical protein